VASLAFPSHNLSPCLWPAPWLILASLPVFFCHPCAQSQSTGLFFPYCCACCLCVFVLILRARVWCSPNWWYQAMVTGTDATVTGIGFWCWTQAMVTGLLVDDDLDLWISGNWWMMFAVPCWYRVCSRNCDIPLIFLRNWCLSSLSSWLSLSFVGFLSLRFADTWSCGTDLISMCVILNVLNHAFHLTSVYCFAA